jgi:hypothetical protein
MTFLVSECLQYQLELRKQGLCKLYVIWQKHLVGLNTGDHPLPSWGPSQTEILEATVAAVTAAWEEVDSDEESTVEGDNDSAVSDDNCLVEGDEWETGLFETLDAVDRADAFRELFQ